MSESRSRLEQLAALFGIAVAYHDVSGQQRVASDATLIALLAEFDVDASTHQRIEQARHAALASVWREALPPVAAVVAGATRWKLQLHLAASVSSLFWSLDEEGGARHSGSAETSALAAIGQAQVDGVSFRECELEFAFALPAGYHTLTIDGLPGKTLVVAAPAHCYRIPALGDSGRVWGPAVQLYALRSEHNWGIGDFGDLARLVEIWGERGAGIIGLNPLHALFPHNPAHASPYSPSSRSRLNVLYIDVEALEDFRECEAAQRRVRSAPFQAQLARLRALPLVDHRGVAAAKFEILELLYAHFRERHLASQSERAREFQEFRTRGGDALRQHALFEAIQAHLHVTDASVWGWPVWPIEYRDHASAAVKAFETAHLDRVEWYEYLQWHAERQLARASESCRANGLAVGLYLDLAVSVDRAGSDTWTQRETFAVEASVGAPPDDFNPNGQGWGLPPLRPDRQRADGYRSFVSTLRENMRNAGALRIDHVMGLMRLFWIPAGKSATDGAYVHYRLDEMLAIVALESERNRCMVIGEDLGTVADEVRAALARYELLSYRLLYFERRDGGEFKPSAEYARDALVAVSTHDLPTLAGWWHGDDLRLRLALGLYPNEAGYEKQLVDRSQDRLRLLLALRHVDLLPPGITVELTTSQELTPALVEAIHAFVAAAPSRVMVMQLEDAIGMVEQANLPGTTDEHPNWRRKLSQSLEEIVSNERVTRLAHTLARLRPHPAKRVAAAPAPRAIEARVPRATYRLQFNRDFGFDAAVAILPYLARLGISHVYCSPILRARAGSDHGYDIVAHDEINAELGGREGFDRFSAALRHHGMGQLLDMVPNHMGVLGADNAWWMDVLENGPASTYAQHFDIDWQPVDPDLHGKVLVPVLGAHYGDELAQGALVVAFEHEGGSFALHYHEHRFPLDPRSYPVLLARAEARVAETHTRALLSSLAAAFGHLPGRDAPDAQALVERIRDKELHKLKLAELVSSSPVLGQAIDAALAELNADGPRDELHELLEVQAYRLAYWRVAADEINYRRFFDINELAALRMENEAVFETTHGFALELAAAGIVDGLRIDHPDGLYDPAQYFRRLQQGYARRVGITLPERDVSGRPARPLYVVAEKIAARHEHVPESWHVHGTTGYRFATVVNGVLVDGSARERLDRIWRVYTGDEASFDELAYRGKRAIMRSALASELTVLATALLRVARGDRRTRDYTFNTLRQALAEVAACMPVYRTYIVDKPSEQDLRYVDWAVAYARRRSRAADTSIFEFVRRSMLGRSLDGASAELRVDIGRFAMRFQQFCAPVAAKGVEDTAFYRYARLASLNEVGGDPGLFGITVRAFHGASADRAARWPHTILATSTHDNKRSEDVRNRIDVLSEMPGAWRLALRRWSTLNKAHRKADDAITAPCASDEYLLYQTLLGTCPASGLDDATLAQWRERIQRYMLKAAREAKANTSWISPNEAYEEALHGYVGALLVRLHPNPFLDELRALAATVAWFGALNSLSMTLIKFTSPGVPDVYQGNELMDLSLVDPDNRRPVDYAQRARWLEELDALSQQRDWTSQLAAMTAAPHDGRAKLWLSWRLLELRRRLPELFRDGGYAALEALGQHAEHVLAYTRRHGDALLVVIAARLHAKLLTEPGRLPLGDAVWGDTTIELPVPDGTRLENTLTGEQLVVMQGRIRIAQAFAHFPGAALIATDQREARS